MTRREMFKNAAMAAALSYMAIQQQDSVGLALFDDAVRLIFEFGKTMAKGTLHRARL